jgi:hypothetical protein
MRFQTIIAAIAVGVAITGCGLAPIQNVSQATVAAPQGKPVTHEQVHAAIIRAGAALGWQMADEGPNMIVGTIVLRRHTAVIEIPYSTTSYSIKYRSSVNLDEANGLIHRNYNGWIQNLTKGIDTQLRLL